MSVTEVFTSVIVNLVYRDHHDHLPYTSEAMHQMDYPDEYENQEEVLEV